MAAIKTPSSKGAATPEYYTTEAHGNQIAVRQEGANLALVVGGEKIVLTRQNVSDLLPVLTNFAASGILI